MEQLTISVDVMGGDYAPSKMIAGLHLARKVHPDVHFLLYGNEEICAPYIGDLDSNMTFIHASETISSDAKPSFAIRNSKNSSMRLAIEAVKTGHAQGVVSAGNTGAYMALAKLILKTIDGIDRPAITGIVPSLKKDVVMLDLGANVECSAENLVQFAMMGDAFARAFLGCENPSVGLLNIGSEDIKGNAIVKEASRIITSSETLTNFQGFVEGDDICAGTTDVVVTDGFTGNITLKTIEGTAIMICKMLKKNLMAGWLSKMGLLFAHKGLQKFQHSLDPRHYNGAIFLGLNGIAVKSHGGTDEVGFSYAVGTAIDLVNNHVNQNISEAISKMYERQESAMPSSIHATAEPTPRITVKLGV